MAVDIGGTFTDLVCDDEDSGEVSSFKVSTTPDDLSMGILAAIRHVALDPSDISFFVHGSTAGLNAFLERRGAHTALITTRGFRDVDEIGRANRPEMYNLHYRKPQPLLPRRYVYEVPERMAYDGTVEEPLNEAALKAVARAIAAEQFSAVAISFLRELRVHLGGGDFSGSGCVVLMPAAEKFLGTQVVFGPVILFSLVTHRSP